jgi:hypothetical protein
VISIYGYLRHLQNKPGRLAYVGKASRLTSPTASNDFTPGVAETPILDRQHETKEESDAKRVMYIKLT